MLRRIRAVLRRSRLSVRLARRTIITARDLDEFVATSDRLGGPGHSECHDYWTTVEYRPTTVVDQSLDPFSEAYVDRQLALYEEMSGRAFNQVVNEHTALDVDRHAAAVNPYDHGSPGGLAEHIERLSRALHIAEPRRGGKMLDMGCGWGLSSEIGAYCGLSVTAIDVNPDFVSLVNRRAGRFGHDIRARVSTFDDFESTERFDLIMFYESFHHAVRPWALLDRMVAHLAPEGRIALAGEPINNTWWKHWGLRLDPLSVYCIHKFGWFESGWSHKFVTEMFERSGLDVIIVDDPEVGATVVAEVAEITAIGQIAATDIATHWAHEGWITDGHYLVASGTSGLTMQFPHASTRARLGVRNFRQSDIAVCVRVGHDIVSRHVLTPGVSTIEIAPRIDGTVWQFESDRWSPDHELHNGDTRVISFHLESVTFL